MGIFEPILIQILVRNILIGNDEKKNMPVKQIADSDSLKFVENKKYV